MICRADGPPNLQMEWWSGVSGSGDYRPVAPLADIVDEDPFSILNDDCNSMRYKSTFKPQLTQAGDDITFMCVVRDGQETMSANVTLSISPAATMNMETVSPAKEEEPGDGGDDTIVLALGVSVAVLAVLVVALILLILLLRFRRSKKMPEVEPPMPIRPVETVANPADRYEVPVEHFEGGGMRPEGDRQLSINQYDEIDNSPYSHYAVPN
ncbi:hypothetical protein PoB_007316800 [Plakobranchus ocellatus]|uniref:Ig-like domain-containing protein n=1 Tax=Plakobranchus ocellatus TaxID=259542 RepID=A0AAV4DQS9_9GAST|nr:hypothetical protein PoB_007316800 [Plakobranchus ocellatus]